MTKHYILTPDDVVDALDSDVEDVPLSANQGLQLNTKKVEGWVNTACKTWKGTQAEYDAIATKDENTLYFITDQTGTIFDEVYPIGTVYTSVVAALPVVFPGTWESITSSVSGEYKWKRTA